MLGTTMNRIDRLMALVLYLKGRRITRAEEIAQHFELSLRTVYRDMAALSEAGVPTMAEAGVGYSLMKGYHLPPVMFTPEEAGALTMAGVLTRQMTDESMDGSMRSALLKIRAILPKEQQDRIERIEKGTRLSGRRGIEKKVDILDLQRALAERRVVHISYRAGGREEITHREVEPLGLVHYLEHWHLIGWCRLRSDSRDFRLDRIVSMKVEDEQFSQRPGVTLESIVENERNMECVRARIRFSRRVSERARRDWALGIVDEVHDANGVELILETGAYEWMVG